MRYPPYDVPVPFPDYPWLNLAAGFTTRFSLRYALLCGPVYAAEKVFGWLPQGFSDALYAPLWSYTLHTWLGGTLRVYVLNCNYLASKLIEPWRPGA